MSSVPAAARPGSAAPVLEHEDKAAFGFILVASLFFVISGLVALIVAGKLNMPTLLGNISWLQYGRLRPLHVNGMLFGWLLAADMGLSFYLIPRLCGVRLWSEKLGMATLYLWVAIVLGAVGTLLAGMTQGLEYAELPFVLDVLVTIAWVMFGLNIVMTVVTRKYQQMYVAIWYIVGGILWTAVVYIVGNFATMFTSGTNQANLNWFYVHNAVGLIFTPLGLGIGYYFIPKASETPLYSHRLSMVGFWSLAFVYVWTGAHHMLHGPISQWLQTVAILFSVMLMIPVWSLVWNFLATMKGQWHQLKDNVPIKFLMTGTIFYLLTCFQGPMHSLRSVNAIVSKTDWIVGHAHMAVLGAFSFFAIGAAYYAIPRMLKTSLHSDKLANATFWLWLIGGLSFFVSLWIGGFLQGLQWNDVTIPFIDTVKFMRPYWLVRLVGGTLMFTGILIFFWNLLMTWTGRRDRAAVAAA
ncbi:MAG: cbb3-type cytochrome c oxidase subunit I [Acidobacteria bacterium]|nr:cbb3-type cytochrome c oxidase subunit I [Acidobacteriota bacterium]